MNTIITYSKKIIYMITGTSLYIGINSKQCINQSTKIKFNQTLNFNDQKKHVLLGTQSDIVIK